jgi:hypothetical protein
LTVLNVLPNVLGARQDAFCATSLVMSAYPALVYTIMNISKKERERVSGAGVPLGRDVRADGGQSRFRVTDIIARSGTSFGVHGAQKGARIFSHLWTRSESVDKVLLWLRHWYWFTVMDVARSAESRSRRDSVGSH